jgi:PAS domain S-box-containing protein
MWEARWTAFNPRQAATAVLCGALGLLGSHFAFVITTGTVTISLNWSLTFPVLAALAYGHAGAFATGVVGLSAFSGFVAWPNNGYANVATTVVLLAWLYGHALTSAAHARTPRWYTHPLFVQLPLGCLYALAVLAVYPALLRLNPPPWSGATLTSMPADALSAIAAKSFVGLYLCVIVASTALITPGARRALGLQPRPHGESNTGIVAAGLAGGLALWIFTLGLNVALEDRFHAIPVLQAQLHPLEALSLIVFVAGGLLGAQAAAYLSERLRARADELRQGLASLRASEEKLRSVFDSVSEAILLVDAESGGALQVNRRAREVFGGEGDALLERALAGLRDQLASELGDVTLSVTAALDSVARSELKERSWAARDAAGRAFPVSGAIRVAQVDGRDVFVCTVRDVTAQRQIESELEQARKMDALGQLAGGIAHDFNNMLTGILGAAELLEDEVGDSDEARGDLAVIRSATERARDLTRQLLNFARKGVGGSGPLDLHDTIRASVALLNHTLDRGIQIEMRLNAERSTVLGDTAQLQSALLNLGLNAAHAMPNGGHLTFATSVVGTAPNSCIRLVVADTGVGIPSEHLDKIFDPFFTTRAEEGGTGLGLAAVYGVVKQSHGRISVHSRKGGTEFTIELPLTQGTTSDSVARPRALLTRVGTVLVVDDEEIVRATTCALLTRLGWTVIEAKDGVEAVELFRARANEVDVVLLDAIMPRMTGRVCFERLRELKPDVRVILYSGFPRDADIEALSARGLAGFLPKPATQDELERALVSARRRRDPSQAQAR